MIAELSRRENKKTISHTANGDIDRMQRERTHRSDHYLLQDSLRPQ